MKVIGTGAPVMLTLRLAHCEVDGLRAELYRRRATETDAAGSAHRQTGGYRVDRADDLEQSHRELVALTGLLDQLDGPGSTAGGHIEVVGPTSLLGPAIRSAAGEAARDLAETLERFNDPERRCTAQQLKHAVANATAWAESLADYDYVENHAMDLGM